MYGRGMTHTPTERPTLPSADQLAAIATISQGWNADLKVDTGDHRLWLARTGLDDGEPFARTIYVETLDPARGWIDLGHYDGEDPPYGLPGVTPHAFRGEV